MSEFPRITADMIAVAVVAAARSYGDDPVAAVSVRNGVPRRSASAAALGLHYAVSAPITRTARLFRLQPSTVEGARRRMRHDVARAADAAERAVRKAMGERRRLSLPAKPLTLDDRIMVALRDQPRTCSTLATMLGVKELHVSVHLAALAHAGEVEAGPAADVGTRHRLWSLAGQ